MIRHSFKGKVSKFLFFLKFSSESLSPWLDVRNEFIFYESNGNSFFIARLIDAGCTSMYPIFLWWQLSINKSVYFLTLWTMSCLVSSCAFLLLNYFLRLISCVKMCVNGFMLCMGFMIHVILLDYIFYDPRGVDFIANMS